MDHFQTDRYHGPPPEIAVPYFSTGFTEKIQTLEDFYNYAELKGFVINGSLSLTHTSPEDAAAFAQRWLYFAPLCIFLSLQDMAFDEEEFVRETTAGDYIISSVQLPSILDEWTKKERDRGDEDDARTRRFHTVKDVLSMVRHAAATSRDQCPAEINLKVLTSIQALGYSIAIAMKARFPNFFFDFGPRFGGSNVFTKHLSESGWCVSDIHTLVYDFGVDTHRYCTTLRPPRQSVAHDQCTSYKCTAMNINESTYQTQHTSPGCSCNFLHMPLDTLHNLVRQLRVPLVRVVVPNGDIARGSLEVVERGGTDDHVVFSHVWADGLGNASWQNALPVCQLDRLQKIANMAFDSDASRPIPFWIDTLCVPSADPALRNKAIRMMREVYKLATRVVVLDKDIESLSMDDDPTTIAVVIDFSSWMRRLWTYHEAALNKALYFKLKHSILPLDMLKAWASSVLFDQAAVWERHPMVWSVARHTVVSLVRTFQVLDLDSIPRPLTITTLCDAFLWRSTSRAQDEAVIIATFMDLDVDAVLDATGPDKMKLVLRNIRRIPAALAVLSGDRMEEEGFRWAPKSLLGRDEFSKSEPLNTWYDTMLKVNNGQFSNFTAESHVAEVLETGKLRLTASAFAILPGGKDQASISSPFWATIFQGIDVDDGAPIAVTRGYWRISFLRDVGGVPLPLPSQVFFVVAVEEPRPYGSTLTTQSAFIALPDAETSVRIQKETSLSGEQAGPFHCRFYCRVDMMLFNNLAQIQHEDWRRELYGAADGGDGSLALHIAHHIDNAEWVIS